MCYADSLPSDAALARGRRHLARRPDHRHRPVLALTPGISRSGITMSAGLLPGIDRDRRDRFSFFLAIPALTGAAIFEGSRAFRRPPERRRAGPMIVATVAAASPAFVAIAWLLRFIAHHNFSIFIAYRVVLGLLILTARHRRHSPRPESHQPACAPPVELRVADARHADAERGPVHLVFRAERERSTCRLYKKRTARGSGPFAGDREESREGTSLARAGWAGVNIRRIRARRLLPNLRLRTCENPVNAGTSPGGRRSGCIQSTPPRAQRRTGLAEVWLT